MRSGEAFAAALRLHEQRSLDQAVEACEAILARDPGHADALHLRGVLAQRRGEHTYAIGFIRRALTFRPDAPEFLVSLGESYRLTGHTEDAARCFEQALRLQRDCSEAAHGLGLSWLALGRYDEAATALRDAARLRPGSAAIRNNLSHALRVLGRTREALEQLQEAVRVDPDLPEARANLAQTLLECGRASEALPHARAAAARRPGSPEFQATLGSVLCESGDLREALECYKRAIHAAPEVARYHANVAAVLADTDRLDEAALSYDRALALEPRCVEACVGLGWVRHMQGRAREALALYERALALEPASTKVLVKLGLLLEEMGNDAGAERAFRDAQRCASDGASGHAPLANLLRGRLPEADFARLRQAARAPDVSDAVRADLHFATALVLDARQEYADAAAELGRANALRSAAWQRRGLGYIPAVHERLIDGLISACAPEFFSRRAGWGDPSTRPVFIFGLPRSGTTLTEQMLAAHPQVFGAGELSLAREEFESLRTMTGGDATLPDSLARLDRVSVAALAGRHLERLAALDDQALRVTDKMTENYLYLGLLTLLFPNARFIHCRRDWRDVALSCWMTDFRQIRWASDPEHIALRFEAYARLMDHWRRVLPVSILEIDYEETVADPEGAARRLVAWCGLEWDAKCLDFHARERPIHTASAQQVRQPVYVHAVGRWRRYEAPLGPWFDRLGPGPAHAR